MKNIEKKTTAKILFSLLPLFFCFITILCFVLSTEDILTNDGQGNVVRHSRFLLQLGTWYPVIAISLIGSLMYYLILRKRNRQFIIGSWLLAFMLGILALLHLGLNISVGLWLFPPNNIASSISFLSPYLILASFIIVYFLFMKDSIKIIRSTAV